MATAVITADELRRRLDAGDDFVLVDVLAPMVYAHSHLPGAINLPPSAVAPTRLARRPCWTLRVRWWQDRAAGHGLGQSNLS